MGAFFELLKIILPSLLMLLAVIYLVNSFLRDHEKRQTLKLSRTNRQITLPLRLQAYERMIIFLERIAPDAIVMRADYPDKSSAQLLNELIQAIRAEYEHNLSQQLYLTLESWEIVKNAKNYTIAFISSVAKELTDDAPAIELSRKILEKVAELEQTPSQKAIVELKRDIQQQF